MFTCTPHSAQPLRELCKSIDRGFETDDASGGLGLQNARAGLRAKTLEAAVVDLDTKISQKHLSNLIDAASKQSLIQSEHADAFFQAHMALCSLPSAGAWLTATPADDAREMDAPLFQVALKRKLRVPVYEVDSFCPLLRRLLGQVR